nr:hypothetical protein [Tanacetum cinerariifolium]
CKITTSLINLGGTEVTESIYDMNNSTSSNTTSSTTLPNAIMSGLADMGVSSFTLMLNTNDTRDVVTISGQSGWYEGSSHIFNKLSPTYLGKANLRKLDANVPNDVDFEIWLTLASVHEVNDRMQNSLYGYFIGKMLAFLVVEWFVRNN